MRMFTSTYEAAREIERDLFKAPKTESGSIQNIAGDINLREALTYSYCITGDIEGLGEILGVAQELGFIKEEEKFYFAQWAEEELISRTSWRPQVITEKINPRLRNMTEGHEPSYTYTDRLRGMTQIITTTLMEDLGSRRAYWPIFIPQDAERASRLTRIPCSLGYWFAIREVNGEKLLHVTYLQRSCDFRRFWIWDVWFARQLQKAIVELLGFEGIKVRPGAFSHVILSFHVTLDNDEEIY